MEFYIRTLFLEATNEMVKETDTDPNKYIFKSEYIKQSIHADYAYSGLIPLYQLIKHKHNNLKLIAESLIIKIKDKDTKSKNIIHNVDFIQPYINIMISNKYLYFASYKFINMPNTTLDKSIFEIADLSNVVFRKRNTLINIDNMLTVNRKKNIM
jgi:hypothetical protein